MSEVFTNRSQQGQVKAAPGKSAPPEPPRIRIDVPMGTSHQEIQESIFHQVYQLAGTQLRAAIALGITPDTVSRVLRRHDRKRIALPQVTEAWPVVAVNRVIAALGQGAADGESPTPDRAASGEHEARTSGTLTNSENGPQERSPASTPGDQHELKKDD